MVGRRWAAEHQNVDSALDASAGQSMPVASSGTGTVASVACDYADANQYRQIKIETNGKILQEKKAPRRREAFFMNGKFENCVLQMSINEQNRSISE